MKTVSVYKHDFGYARDHGEIEKYSNSLEANRTCAKAIDRAVSENYDGNTYCLDSVAAFKQVVAEYGIERTMYVLANAVRHKMNDGRISSENKKWALENYIITDANAHDDRTLYYVPYNAHPGLIDLVVTKARTMHHDILPLTEEEVRAEAQRILEGINSLKAPNSQAGTHYQVEVAYDFLLRANTKDTEKLARLLPYNTLCLSTIKGERGVYVSVSAKEGRKTELKTPKKRGRSKKGQEELAR